MRSYLVAVVDGAHARFFTLNAAGFLDEDQSGARLTEHSNLNNIEKPIANKGNVNNIGRKHHGNRHEKTTQFVETNRRFATRVLNHVGSLLANTTHQHLILVAEPNILGVLRDSVASYVPSTTSVSELAKDLCRLSTHDLHRYLTNKQLLPCAKRVSPGL